MNTRAFVMSLVLLATRAALADGTYCIETDAGLGQAERAKLHLEAGAKFISDSRFDRAKACLQSAARLSPNEAAPHIRLGEMYQLLTDVESAKSEYLKAVELEPSNASAHNHLGVLYDRMFQNEKALAEYQKAAELEPKNPTAHYNIGVIEERLEHLAEAVKAYEKAAELEPKNDLNHYLTGRCLIKLGRYEEAAGRFGKALEIAPNDPVYRGAFGASLNGLGRFREAIAEYRKAVALEPTTPSLHGDLGALYTRIERHNEAIHHFELALKYSPKNPHYANSLGMAYQLKGMTDEAMASYRKALQLMNGGDGRNIQVNIAILEALRGNSKEAFDELARALPEPTADLQSVVVWAKVNFLLGRLEKAEELLLAATKAAPNEILLNLILGDLYFAGADLDRALAQYESVLRVAPGNVRARVKILRVLAEAGRLNPKQEGFYEYLYSLIQAVMGEPNRSADSSGDLAEALRVLIEAGLYDALTRNIQKYSAEFPVSGEIRLIEAELMRKAFEGSRWRDAALEAIALDPLSVRGNRVAFELRIQSADYMGAIEAFERAYMRGAAYWSFKYFNRAFKSVAQVKTAIKGVDKLLRGQRDQRVLAVGYLLKGMLEVAAGHEIASIKSLRMAIQLRPDSALAHRVLLEAYADNKDFEAAQAQLEKFKKVAPIEYRAVSEYLQKRAKGLVQ